jgi:hypothetical protein
MNTDRYIILEKEVIDIIKNGPAGRAHMITATPIDMLNNYFLNKAYFIAKNEFYNSSCMNKNFIDNYGNIYEFVFAQGQTQYWCALNYNKDYHHLCINYFEYKIKLQEIVIDTIKLIITDSQYNFTNAIRGIVKINEQYEKNNNLIILENEQLKEENEQLKEENKQLKEENKQLKEENEQLKEENKQLKNKILNKKESLDFLLHWKL